MPLDAYLPVSEPTASKPHPIVGYTKPDGRVHEWKGFLSSLSADSVRFVADSDSVETFNAARNEIQTVLVRKRDDSKTRVFVLGIATTALLAFLAIVAATWEWE